MDRVKDVTATKIDHFLVRKEGGKTKVYVDIDWYTNTIGVVAPLDYTGRTQAIIDGLRSMEKACVEGMRRVEVGRIATRLLDGLVPRKQDN